MSSIFGSAAVEADASQSMERSMATWRIKNVESYGTAGARNTFNREIELELGLALCVTVGSTAWAVTHIAPSIKLNHNRPLTALLTYVATRKIIAASGNNRTLYTQVFSHIDGSDDISRSLPV